MKTILVLFFWLSLALMVSLMFGCADLPKPPRPMTNDEIIREAKKCEDADMSWQRYTSGWSGLTVKIECRKKTE